MREYERIAVDSQKGASSPSSAIPSDSRGYFNFTSIIKDMLVGSANEASMVGLSQGWLVLDPVNWAAPNALAPPPGVAPNQSRPRQQLSSPTRDREQDPDPGLLP